MYITRYEFYYLWMELLICKNCMSKICILLYLLDIIISIYIYIYIYIYIIIYKSEIIQEIQPDYIIISYCDYVR